MKYAEKENHLLDHYFHVGNDKLSKSANNNPNPSSDIAIRNSDKAVADRNPNASANDDAYSYTNFQ